MKITFLDGQEAFELDSSVTLTLKKEQVRLRDLSTKDRKLAFVAKETYDFFKFPFPFVSQSQTSEDLQIEPFEGKLSPCYAMVWKVRKLINFFVRPELLEEILLSLELKAKPVSPSSSPDLNSLNLDTAVLNQESEVPEVKKTQFILPQDTYKQMMRSSKKLRKGLVKTDFYNSELTNLTRSWNYIYTGLQAISMFAKEKEAPPLQELIKMLDNFEVYHRRYIGYVGAFENN